MESSQTLRLAQAAPARELIVGDDDFAHFYLKEYRALVTLAVALTGNQSEAEELVQEALLRVCARWQRIATYERPGAFARRVLINLATSRRRRLAAEARALGRMQRHAAPSRKHLQAGRRSLATRFLSEET